MLLVEPSLTVGDSFPSRCESMSTPLTSAGDDAAHRVDRAIEVTRRDEVCTATASLLLAAVGHGNRAVSGVVVMFGVCAVVGTGRLDAVSFDRTAVSRAMNADAGGTTFVAIPVMFGTSVSLVLSSSDMDDSFPSNEG